MPRTRALHIYVTAYLIVTAVTPLRVSLLYQRCRGTVATAFRSAPRLPSPLPPAVHYPTLRPVVGFQLPTLGWDG